MYSTKRNAGFTLIELLVVIAIIGVLASVVLASLNSARAKARDARRLAEIKQIQTALELIYDQTGAYPGAAGWHDNGCNASYPDLAPILGSSYQLLPDTSAQCLWYYKNTGGWQYILTFVPETPELLTKDLDCYTPASWYCMGIR